MVSPHVNCYHYDDGAGYDGDDYNDGTLNIVQVFKVKNWLSGRSLKTSK